MKGILLLDKPVGISSFWPIPRFRKIFQEKRIGHAGTLDPFASGLMVYLVGREYTRLADTFLLHDKSYEAQFKLGESTDTYDLTGEVKSRSNIIPTLEALQAAIATFQGNIIQLPPMFSAKKQEGRRFYELARAGHTVERKPCPIRVNMVLKSYEYPHVCVDVHCSKGTYIRSLAHDLGELLGTGAHATALRRTASGPFMLELAHPLKIIELGVDPAVYLKTMDFFSYPPGN